MSHIISSAIKFKIIDDDYSHIMCGKRHADIMEKLFKMRIYYNPDTIVHGFLTSEDQFVDRFEAADIAFNAGQITDRNIKKLYSEDIWSE